MTTDSPFPDLPKPSLTREHVIGRLAEVMGKGWDVFKDRDSFVIQTSETTQVRLELTQGGVCHISSRNALGPTASGIVVENLFQLEEALHRILGSAPPARSVRLKQGEPASNFFRIASLVTSQVEAVYDPYLDDRGLRNLHTLVGLGHRMSSDVRLITAGKSANPLTMELITALFRELGCPQGQVRKVLNPKAHRRFMLLSGGKSLIMGMSLNAIDKDETAHTEGDAEDRPFFEEEWRTAVPL